EVRRQHEHVGRAVPRREIGLIDVAGKPDDIAHIERGRLLFQRRLERTFTGDGAAPAPIPSGRTLSPSGENSVESTPLTMFSTGRPRIAGSRRAPQPSDSRT